MTLRRKTTLIFSAAAAAIALASLIVLSYVGAGPKRLGNFHVPALYSVQQMVAHSEQATERSFAYIASGLPVEKERFREEMVEVDEQILAWRALHQVDSDRSQTRVQMVDSIAAVGNQVRHLGEQMFKEFDSSGRTRVSPATYDKYNHAISQLMERINRLMDVEKRGVDAAHSDALSVIYLAAEGIFVVGLLSALLAIILGKMVGRSVSKPIAQLSEAAERIARGDLDLPIPPTGTGEIAGLSASLERMRLDLQASFQRLRLLVEQMPTVLWTTDSQLMITSLEGGGSEPLPSNGISASGRPVTVLFEAHQHDLAVTSHEDALEGHSTRFESAHADQTFRNYVEPLKDPEGRIVGTIGVSIDTTESKVAEETITHLAHHDPLTDLPNRILFQDRLTQDLAHARRRGDSISLLFIDLDGFKHVNDGYGHSTGDRLLQIVAGRLTSCIREEDTLARLGGDEFAAIQSGSTSIEGTAALAQRMISALNSSPIQIDGRDHHVTCSIGVAVDDTGTIDAEMLVARADMAMYQAKGAGRDRYQFFDEAMNKDVHDKLALEADLRRALEADEFFLEYQPIIELSTGRVRRFEALLRWRHPERGLIPPNDFIPIAESSGLIVPIGDWILLEACSMNKALIDAGKSPVKVAINVSAVQLRRQCFTGKVRQILKDTGLPTECLELELTESTLVTDASTASRTLHGIASLGATVSIDDFGTGYSSLDYLRRLDVDILKIDRSFIMDLERDTGAEAIVKAVIGLAGNLGLRSIAEGVETAQQLEFLRENGCDEVQGFYFSYPVSPEALSDTLEEDYELEYV